MRANDYVGTEAEMSIFPAKIILATDGSSESELALGTAVDLANSTGSELHVVHVASPYHPDLLALRDPALFEEGLRGLDQETEELLDGQVRKIEEAGGACKKLILGGGEKTSRSLI